MYIIIYNYYDIIYYYITIIIIYNLYIIIIVTNNYYCSIKTYHKTACTSLPEDELLIVRNNSKKL